MTFPIPDPEDIRKTLALPDLPVHIDTGGFKAVYSAQTSGGMEALKTVFIPQKKDNDDGEPAQRMARAKREIEILGACDCDALVKLGSIEPQSLLFSGHQYLVYSEELISGSSVFETLQSSQRYTFSELSELFGTLVQVIDSIASCNYLHRDIKPKNIMVTGISHRPYIVIDLGIAYKMHGTELTQGGGPPGSLLYMAPELLMPGYKDVMDFRCDLYSAALTLYVCASLIHPFAADADNSHATAYRIINQRAQPLSKHRPDLPIKFCRVIDRCIRKKPALRYANLNLLRSDLEEVRI